MDDYKISVVVPTYNSSSYIIRTLDSVLKQTELPDEIVLVDDGSLDNTIEILNDYKKKYKDKISIVIIKQKNKGAGAARNRGVKEAQGKWIAFLDSDDIWLPGKIGAVKNIIRKYPDISIIAHDEYVVDENDMNHKTLCKLHEMYNEKEELFIQLYKGNLFSTSCMTIRKDLIEKAGGFDESLRSAQDYDLWIRCGLYGILYYIPEAYEIYVTREGNITANTYRRYLCEMRICRKYIPEIEKRLGKKETESIVRRRIFRIHKVETYLSLKQKKLGAAWSISTRLFPEIIKGAYK